MGLSITTQRCRFTSSGHSGHFAHSVLINSTVVCGCTVVDPKDADRSMVDRRSNVPERSFPDISDEHSMVWERLKVSVRFDCGSSVTLQLGKSVRENLLA